MKMGTIRRTWIWIVNKKFKLFIFLSVFLLIMWKFPAPLQSFENNHDGIQYSTRGFWRGNLAWYHSSHFEPKLADRLLNFFINENATSIIDLGGGAGLHVEHFIDHGLFALCYDGNPESQDISHGYCANIDLTKPIHFAKSDWVLSLKVGRQIPPFVENEFITNIHNMNTRGVVIFWGDGKPFRSNHPKNVKNNNQVVDIFQALGYENDVTAGKYLRGDYYPAEEDYSLLVLRKKSQVNIPIPRPFQLKNLEVAKSDQGVISSDFISIAVTSCGLDKIEEALTMIKSAILFSQHTKLKAFIFVDGQTLGRFEDRMKELRQRSRIVNPNFKYEILPTNFPNQIEGMSPWKQVLKPCSLQKMFLPTILPSIDALIYMDADSIFLSNLTEFWNLFSYMKPKSFIGATQMTESQKSSWFKEHYDFPHYGNRGLNTGISLMNLTRMRSENFSSLITLVRKHYEYIRPTEEGGDQFLQNILYSFYPEYVSLIPCEWSLRPDHCRCVKDEKCACQSALGVGVAVIHGTRNAFSNEGRYRFPFFQNIYETFRKYNFTSDTLPTLLENLTRKFQDEKHTCFFNDASSFYQRLEKYTGSLQ